MKWTDDTGYSQGDTQRVPRIWSCCAGRLRITVHRHIHYGNDQWLLTCGPLFEKSGLESKDIDAAKTEALELVRSALKLAIKELT